VGEFFPSRIPNHPLKPDRGIETVGAQTKNKSRRRGSAGKQDSGFDLPMASR
jgi:hypothetical protein